MAAWSTDQSNDILLHSQNRPTGDRWLKVNIQCFEDSRVSCSKGFKNTWLKSTFIVNHIEFQHATYLIQQY